MASNSDKKLISQKLLPKQGRVEKLKKEDARNKIAEVPDIEDSASSICTNIRSPYFSPLQTRQQRKAKHLSLIKDSGLTGTKINLIKENQVKVNAKTNLQTLKPLAQKTTKCDAIETSRPLCDEIKTLWEPENWRSILENIRIMRLSSPAPVDTMGCHKCVDENTDEKTRRFQMLVALMLSSQTRDQTTFEAMQRLRSHTLTPNALVEMEATQLEDLLRTVSFYKNKAKHLQQTSRILIEKYNSDIPNNIKELIALPGVGPKMAHICMSVAWNEVTGIGVDVHVHRIVNRLRWVQRETKEPEKTRVALEKWLPRDLWKEVNHLLVGFGQTICTPTRPHCGECLNQNICPSAEKIKGPKIDRRKKTSDQNVTN